MIRNLLLGVCILFALSVAAKADLIDPKITTGGGDPSSVCYSSPIMDVTTGINEVQAVSTCTSADPDVVYNFINNLGNFPKQEDLAAIITGFTFQTKLEAGLTGLAADFTCDAGGYFKDCNGSYNSSTGVLDYVFSGVNPADGDEYCNANDTPKDNEYGEKEGIPACGVFHITLTGFFGSDLPTTSFTNAFFTETPEPTTILSLSGGLLLLLAIVEFRRRRQMAPAILARTTLK
jgi:hypothetical protein